MFWVYLCVAIDSQPCDSKVVEVQNTAPKEDKVKTERRKGPNLRKWHVFKKQNKSSCFQFNSDHFSLKYVGVLQDCKRKQMKCKL